MERRSLSTTTFDRKAQGSAGEARALKFLVEAGLLLLDAGWRCRLGELDLVMLDRGVLVFVEVRFRRGGNLVSAIESIDTHKQRRFVRAARAWLACHPKEAALPARFDIVALTDDDVQWLRDAIEVRPG